MKKRPDDMSHTRMTSSAFLLIELSPLLVFEFMMLGTNVEQDENNKSGELGGHFFFFLKNLF